jgi:hypothetical protein
MRYIRNAAGVLLVLILACACLGAGTPTATGGEQRSAEQPAVVLEGLPGPLDWLIAPPKEMNRWTKTAQARCPPGQLVFLTNACGCNGACCACSGQTPYLDHCTCKCSATPPTACRNGFSAGRR